MYRALNWVSEITSKQIREHRICTDVTSSYFDFSIKLGNTRIEVPTVSSSCKTYYAISCQTLGLLESDLVSYVQTMMPSFRRFFEN